MGEFVGLDPAAATALANKLDRAAADLDAHAHFIRGLLSHAGASSAAPAELGEIAGWARYRARDLRRRIDKIVAAAGGGDALQLRGFRFANRAEARKAAVVAAMEVQKHLRSQDHKGVDAALDSLKRHGNDPAYAAGFFKALGPAHTYALLTATAGRDSAAAVGAALVLARRSGGLPVEFIDGIIAAARQAAEAFQAYTGLMSKEDRARLAEATYIRWQGSGHPQLAKLLEAIAPLTPYLEAGAKVAVIGGAVVIITGVAACAFLSVGACLGPTIDVIASTEPLDAQALQAIESEFSGLSARVVDTGSIVDAAGTEQLAVAGGQSNFMASSEKFAEYAARAKPLEGYHDVIVHGAAGDFGATADAWSTGTEFSHRALAALIERDPGYLGGPIRLLACDTGGVGATAAQDLANRLGVEVLAPTDTLWAYPSGNLVVGPTPTSPAGGWEAFFPGGPR
jgi:hypothetical protein